MSTAVGIKRLHDRNKSGWWLLLFYLVPSLLNVIVLFTGIKVLYIASTGIGLYALVELGFQRGTVGPNQYGPDPLSRP